MVLSGFNNNSHCHSFPFVSFRKKGDSRESTSIALRPGSPPFQLRPAMVLPYKFYGTKEFRTRWRPSPMNESLQDWRLASSQYEKPHPIRFLGRLPLFPLLPDAGRVLILQQRVMKSYPPLNQKSPTPYNIIIPLSSALTNTLVLLQTGKKVIDSTHQAWSRKGTFATV